MTEEKQNKINEIIEEQKPGWLTALRVVVIFIVVVFAAIGGFIAFLQLTTFDQVQQALAPETFVAQTRDTLAYGDEGFKIDLPDEVIAYEVKAFLANQFKEKDVTLESLYYSGQAQKVYTNLSYKGFYVPLSISLRIQQINTGFTVDYDDLRLSNREWSIGDWLETSLKEALNLSNSRQTINIYDAGVNNLLKLRALTEEEGHLSLRLTIDDPRIEEEVNKIRDAIDPLLLEHYKTYSASRTQPVLAMVESIYPLTSDQEQALINDGLGSQYIISDLLLLTKGYVTDGLQTLMVDYGLDVATEEIDLEKKAFKGQAVDGDIAQIFLALDQHFGEGIMAFNQGEPFDLDLMTTMTVSELIRRYQLPIKESIAKDMSFVYDDAFKVAYKLDDHAYYVRGLDGYEVLDAETVEAMPGGGVFVKPTYTDDPVLWQQTIDFIKGYFSVDEVFVRYMKSDGRSVFAVISNGDDPQDYWAMALMANDGNFTVLEENVKSILRLMTEHPEFNIEAATKVVETVSFERISDDIHDLIIDELYDQGIITSKNDTKIIYSSYDGKTYIAFKLSNGDEYVYKVEGTVYGTYLTTVYTKSKALRNWENLSELLVLQDSPN